MANIPENTDVDIPLPAEHNHIHPSSKFQSSATQPITLGVIHGIEIQILALPPDYSF